jgi:hypothetical protein
MKFAYADPPYLGMGKKMYGKLHPEAAIWDDPQAHKDLVTRLMDEYPDGWAISLGTPSLGVYMSAAPSDARVGAWVKTWHQIRPTTTQFAWEPVIWRGGRKDNKRSPMVRDWHQGNAARGQGLQGSKPPDFNRWILDLLNYQPGDELDDLFPGTNGMTRETQKLLII